MERNNKKRGIRIGVTATILLGIAVIAGYIYLTAYPSGIQPPLGRTIGFSAFEFDADQGCEIHLPTGSHITIPAKSVVNEKGRPVHGKVRLKFREYHTPEDIFLSGIPMQRSEDRDAYLQSGGMFEIRLDQKGKPLQLKADEAVSVDLANYRNANVGDDFKLYFLTDDTEWDSGRMFETVPNFRRDTALTNLQPPPSAPINPVPGADERLFGLQFDPRMLPHLKAWRNTTFEYLKHKNGLPFEDALRVDWDGLKIKEGEQQGDLEFTFSFTRTNVKMEPVKHHSSFIARPMLSGAELENVLAQFREDMDKYAETIEKLDQERQRIEQEAVMLSRFTVAQVGVFNIDYLSKMDVVRVEMSFDFDEEINPLFNQIMLHVVLEDRNTVVKYNFADWDEIPALNERVSLVAVLPGGKVAYVSADQYLQKIRPDDLRPGSQYKFRFTTERIEMNDFFDRFLKRNTVRGSTPRII